MGKKPSKSRSKPKRKGGKKHGSKRVSESKIQFIVKPEVELKEKTIVGKKGKEIPGLSYEYDPSQYRGAIVQKRETTPQGIAEIKESVRKREEAIRKKEEMLELKLELKKKSEEIQEKLDDLNRTQKGILSEFATYRKDLINARNEIREQMNAFQTAPKTKYTSDVLQNLRLRFANITNQLTQLQLSETAVKKDLESQRKLIACLKLKPIFSRRKGKKKAKKKN